MKCKIFGDGGGEMHGTHNTGLGTITLTVGLDEITFPRDAIDSLTDYMRACKYYTA